MRALRRAGAVAAVLALLLLSACKGAQADVTFTFAEDGSFTQNVSVEGMVLSADEQTTLEHAGWEIDSSSEGFIATHDFASVNDYGDANTELDAVLLGDIMGSGAYSEFPDTRSRITRITTDYFFLVRHQVELSLSTLDFKPDSCSECGGSGSIDCTECGGDGRSVCSSCNGRGYTQGWYGDYECYTCEGDGYVTCWSCGGSGYQTCGACGGSGEPGESDLENYKDVLDASAVRVSFEMPGLTIPQIDPEPVWDFEGDKIEKIDTLVATSYVIDWTRTGIGLGVLVGLLLLLVWAIVRAARRGRAKRQEKREARAAAKAAKPAKAATVVDPATRFCRGCGKPVPLSARFCPSCGTPGTSAQAPSEDAGAEAKSDDGKDS